jgi:hypothetical protein
LIQKVQARTQVRQTQTPLADLLKALGIHATFTQHEGGTLAWVNRRDVGFAKGKTIRLTPLGYSVLFDPSLVGRISGYNLRLDCYCQCQIKIASSSPSWIRQIPANEALSLGMELDRPHFRWVRDRTQATTFPIAQAIEIAQVQAQAVNPNYKFELRGV